MKDGADTDAGHDRSETSGRGTNTHRDRMFDIALGSRIRAFRIAAGMSQTALGQAIGVSCQQVLKYELGKDRVAVGTLKAISDALAVHPGVFFDGDMLMPSGSWSTKKAAIKAAAVLQQVSDPRVRKRLVDLAKALGADAGGEGA